MLDPGGHFHYGRSRMKSSLRLILGQPLLCPSRPSSTRTPAPPAGPPRRATGGRSRRHQQPKAPSATPTITGNPTPVPPQQRSTAPRRRRGRRGASRAARRAPPAIDLPQLEVDAEGLASPVLSSWGMCSPRSAGLLSPRGRGLMSPRFAKSPKFSSRRRGLRRQQHQSGCISGATARQALHAVVAALQNGFPITALRCLVLLRVRLRRVHSCGLV
eukprot:gene7699-biopygen1507